MKKLMIVCICACMCATLANAQSQTKKVLRHVVLFKFKESATPANIESVEEAFAKLPSQIKVIKGFEWGLNNSPEKLNNGLTHCFTLTFESEKDRDSYIIFPAHKDFGKLLGPFLEKVVVVDYWTK